MTNQVLLKVSEEGADDQRLDELARLLRLDLLQTDVADVVPHSSGDAPADARSGTAMIAGALLASVGAMPLTGLLAPLIDWLRSGRARRTVRVEIDGDVLVLQGVNDDTQQRLMTDWLDRHPVGTTPST